MRVNHISPVLYTKDIKATVDFYVTILGFTCEGIAEEWGWTRVQKDSIELMFSKPNEHTPFDTPAFTGSFYFNISGVDELWEKVKDTAPVCYAPENFDYGMREFAVYDNNGYLLQFGEEIAAAS